MLGKVLGAWQTNFTFTAQTGNATQVNDGTGRPDSWSRFDRPDLVANPDLPLGRSDRVPILQHRCVVRTPRFGTAPRMMVRQPGPWNLDFALAKRFRIRERLGMIVRADACNFFNHANWRTIDTTIRNVPNPNVGPPGTLQDPYGRVNAFGDPREVAVSLKLEF